MRQVEGTCCRHAVVIGMEEQLINIAEAARLLGVCKATLRDWDKSGVLKPIRTPGNHRRYRLSDIHRVQEGKHFDVSGI